MRNDTTGTFSPPGRFVCVSAADRESKNRVETSRRCAVDQLQFCAQPFAFNKTIGYIPKGLLFGSLSCWSIFLGCFPAYFIFFSVSPLLCNGNHLGLSRWEWGHRGLMSGDARFLMGWIIVECKERVRALCSTCDFSVVGCRTGGGGATERFFFCAGQTRGGADRSNTLSYNGRRWGRRCGTHIQDVCDCGARAVL